MAYKSTDSRQVVNRAALSVIGSSAGDSLDDILSKINNALNGTSTTRGMVSDNDSSGPQTVLTGTSLFIPYLDILTPDTYTVQTGAELVGVTSIIVNGNLIVNGTGIVRIL